MDVNDMRSLVTVVSFAAFVGITVWAWQRSRRQAFDEAAALPFADEANSDTAGRTSTGEQQ
jgi:cytochrome c oxidase cbb3-type subunit 4